MTRSRKSAQSFLPDSLPTLSIEQRMTRSKKALKNMIDRHFLEGEMKEVFGDEFTIPDDFFLNSPASEIKATPATILAALEEWADTPKKTREEFTQWVGVYIVEEDELEQSRFIGLLTQHLDDLHNKLYSDLRQASIKYLALASGKKKR